MQRPRACIGCKHHTKESHYSTLAQTLYIIHGCHIKQKTFKRGKVDMPTTCKDREEE